MLSRLQIPRVVFVVILSLVVRLNVFGQDSQVVHGKVIDSETKTPVPFASIAITNSTRGTAADENGNFALMIKSIEARQSLKISSIGYLTKHFNINALDSGRVDFVLQSDVRSLGEVEINESAINPADIVRNAIDSLKVNYRFEPFNVEYYSTLRAGSAITGQQFQIETILFGYCKGYETNAAKKFEIVKKRSQGENPLKGIDYPYWPTLEIHRADVISDPHKTGILNSANIDKFTFKYAGVSMYETDTVYQIEYQAPKPTKKLTGYGIVPQVYKGVVYITTTSNAIVRHDIVTDQFQHSIIYKKLDDYYFPYLITGERTLKGQNLFTKITNSIILTNVILENVRPVENTTNEFGDITALPDDNEFWEMNYPEVKD